MRLDDLIVSKDKYGMTLTYALHRAFSDLGPAMTEHWQIFLNADFILADGSLRTVIGHLARGERIVASPSYCTIAEEVIPELRKHLDAATSTLSISHRELAQLILQHRHTVIRGKTVNQTDFHMRYTDQFYWSVDESTLLGYQMPVSIVGMRPERYVAEPNSYWDFGLIWEYCPDAEVCVIGDSDEFTMLELRDKSVAEDQVVPGPPDKRAIAELMVTWVTPYQQHFLKFPLTLHDGELPPSTGEARLQLQTFVDEVMSNAPALPSHIKHSQWEYHYPGFHHAREMSSRIRRWLRTKVELAITPAVWLLRRCREIVGFVWRKMMAWAKDLCRPVARVLLDDYLRPALRRLSLEIVKSDTLTDLAKKAFVLLPSRDAEIVQLKQEQAADRSCIADLAARVADLTARVTDLGNIATEYQLKLGRHDLGYIQRPRFTEWVMRRGLLETAFTLVDVGVQGGIHPRWNALGKALRVYGFDPLEETIAPLVRFNLPNHEYHAIALGDQDGERDLFVPEARPASSFFPRETKQDQARMAIDPSNWRGIQTRRVPIRRLDTLMSEGVVPRADFLKIDCEGFEPAVLKGAGRFLGESGVLGIESEIGFSSIDWPQTHFLAVYEQLLPHGFRLSDLAFNRVHFGSFLERARSLGRDTTAASCPGTFEILFSRSLTIAKVVPSRDEVLKAAIIFELYGMLDAAYDLLQVFRSIFPPSAQIEDGADELIPKRGFV